VPRAFLVPCSSKFNESPRSLADSFPVLRKGHYVGYDLLRSAFARFSSTSFREDLLEDQLILRPFSWTDATSSYAWRSPFRCGLSLCRSCGLTPSSRAAFSLCARGESFPLAKHYPRSFETAYYHFLRRPFFPPYGKPRPSSRDRRCIPRSVVSSVPQQRLPCASHIFELFPTDHRRRNSFLGEDVPARLAQKSFPFPGDPVFPSSPLQTYIPLASVSKNSLQLAQSTISPPRDHVFCA